LCDPALHTCRGQLKMGKESSKPETFQIKVFKKLRLFAGRQGNKAHKRNIEVDQCTSWGIKKGLGGSKKTSGWLREKKKLLDEESLKKITLNGGGERKRCSDLVGIKKRGEREETVEEIENRWVRMTTVLFWGVITETNNKPQGHQPP